MSKNDETAQVMQAAEIAATPRQVDGAKRAVSADVKEKSGLSTQDLILIAVLLAAGAVLKMTVATFFQAFGMKPNFIIAMYCLAIILTKPTIKQSMIIGLLAGLVCQVALPATYGLNIISEFLGALVCGLLIRVPMKIGGKVDANPVVSTFFSTIISGGSFALIAIFINVVMPGGTAEAVAAAIAAYAAIVLGTAAFNAILNGILTPLMRKVLKK